MDKVVFVTSPFAEKCEFLGVDGEIYVLEPNTKLILPYLNAKILEDNNVGKIVGEYEEPKAFPEPNFDEDGEDLIKDWAKMMLQLELQKPNPDIDRVIELRMLIKGINPTQFLYKSKDEKEVKPIHTHSPTGMSTF